MTPVLEVERLRTEFRMRTANVVAVDGVSFQVNQGECVGIVGESGCGKSTTGFSIMRLLPINGHLTDGRIMLNGRDLAGLSEKEMQGVRGDEVALIPQDPLTSLNPTMTIGRQIGEAVRLHRDVSRQQVRDRALEVLSMVEMPRPAERLDQYPHELSGGLRQRVMIAMALACEPKLLIADEPTTALDVTIQAQILDLIDDLRERLRMAVVLITHDMGVIAGRTDRVVVMYAGKVAEEADTVELFSRMRHPYSEALLESVPKFGSQPGRSTAQHLRAAARPLADHHQLPLRPALPVRHGSVPGRGPPAGGRGRRVGPSPVRLLPPGQSPPDGGGHRGRSRRGPAVWRLAVRRCRHCPRSSGSMVWSRNSRCSAGSVIRRTIGTVKAVSDVAFSVRRGETFGLVGESGCGKTTVGRLIVALERPTAGTIEFEGHDVHALAGGELRSRRRDLQLMFQDPYASLDPRMRVGSIIREPLRVQRVGSTKEQDERVRSLLSEVGLSDQALGRYPHEFSGGQRQRIGLARALALDPKLVVADEPVSALDVSVQAQILNLMKDLQARHGLTFLMISHDLAVIRYMADTIGVMYLGKLVELGPAAQIYERPGPPVHQGPARSGAGARRERQGPHGGEDGGAGRAALGRGPPFGVSFPHPVPQGRSALCRGRAALQPVWRWARRGLPLPAGDAGDVDDRRRSRRQRLSARPRSDLSAAAVGPRASPGGRRPRS